MRAVGVRCGKAGTVGRAGSVAWCAVLYRVLSPFGGGCTSSVCQPILAAKMETSRRRDEGCRGAARRNRKISEKCRCRSGALFSVPPPSLRSSALFSEPYRFPRYGRRPLFSAALPPPRCGRSSAVVWFAVFTVFCSHSARFCTSSARSALLRKSPCWVCGGLLCGQTAPVREIPL